MSQPNTLITLVVLLCALASTSLAHAETATTTLYEGPNLVGFFLELDDSDPASVFSSLEDRLVSVATHGADGWDHYFPSNAGHPDYLSTLDDIVPGVGYVVTLSPGDSVDLEVTGVLPERVERQLEEGWNLVQFLHTRDVPWHEPLGEQRMLAGGVAVYSDELAGFLLPDTPFGDTGEDGDPEELDWLYEDAFGSEQPEHLAPGQACWIRTHRAFPLGPQLELWMESDSDGDATPCEDDDDLTEDDFPSADDGDVDLNNDGSFNYGYTLYGDGEFVTDECGREIRSTQDTICFRPQSGDSERMTLRRNVTVMNRGNRDGKEDYSGNDELRFEIELDTDLESWLTVEPQAGTVQGPFDPVSVELSADLEDLPVGVHTGTLTVRSNGGDRELTIRLDVPDIAGTFSGDVSVWVGEAEDQDSAALRDRRLVTIQIADDTCTIVQARTPSLEDDLVLTLSVEDDEPAGSRFTATGTLDVAADSPSNVLGLPYTRTITLAGRRSADGEAGSGAQLPLQGSYTETIVIDDETDELDPVEVQWSGVFFFQQQVSVTTSTP